MAHELIVVGLDHTPAGSAALRWAVAEAQRIDGRVMAVSVYDRDARQDLAAERDHEAERTRERIAAHRQILEQLGEGAARLRIALTQTDGPVATRLAQAAERASLLVLGKPTDEASRRLPEQLGRACSCPVMVVDEDGSVWPVNAFLELASDD